MIVRVRRFDPAADRRPRWQSYTVDARPMMSVLDALFWILEQLDSTLAFRYSCRAGMCGSCAMVVNGREGLACGLRLEHLRPPVSVEPLRSLPVVKDLLVDLRPFFDKYRAVDPFYVGETTSLLGPAADPAVIPPGGAAREVVDRQIDCISCGACYSACPVAAIVPEFLGPAALNRAYAVSADTRDKAGAERLRLVASDGGIFACHSVGNCVTVCPVGVNPLLSIQLLRKGAVHR
ncbi:MAG TPA: succinate dehydrogenase iron-sulfur subunit [bacterium]|nr:succinate dehydrogenase iron-sulfur subunit [bacterium]